MIGIVGQVLEYLFPDAMFCPAAPAAMRVLPIAKTFRQIPPRHTRAIAIANRVHKKPMVKGGAANMSFASGQKILDPFPWIIAQRIASYHRLAPPFRLTLYE